MDDSIHKKLFACLNPCRSHSNDILCASESVCARVRACVRTCVCVVCAWAVRCPCARKCLRDDLGGFNTTLLYGGSGGVKLSPPAAE